MATTEATEWFAVMTLQAPLPGGGFATATKATVLTVPPDATREGIYAHMRGLFPHQFDSANTVYFVAEPNRIGGAS